MAHTDNQGFLGPFQNLTRKFWVPFLLACAIVIPLEAAFDRVAETGEAGGITQSIFNISGLYQRLVTAPREPFPRYTAVVTTDPDKDPKAISLHDICSQRKSIALAMRTIADAMPKAIVLDKYFLVHPCPDGDVFLREAIRYASAKTRIVVGRRIPDETVVTVLGPQNFLLPSLQLRPNADVDNPTEGVVNIDPDTRKLPLEWSAFDSEQTAMSEREERHPKDLKWHETLSLTAARAYDDHLLARRLRLADYIQKAEHPYVSFFQPADFDPILIGDLLEDRSSVKSSPTQENNALLGKMSGKIVLIGEINADEDSHASVVGEVPGLFLQANYIEALLDDRYFRSMPALDYVVGFIFLILLELILIVHCGRWTRTLILVTGLFVATIAVLYFFVKIFGWYVNPLPIGATAIVIKLLHMLFSRAEKAAET